MTHSNRPLLPTPQARTTLHALQRTWRQLRLLWALALGALLLLPGGAWAQAGAWASAGSMTTARQQHTSTVFPNGKVLVAGGVGYGLGILASAELYDPASNTWSAVGSMVAARYVHTATLLPNGKVLVAGGSGFNGPISSPELYDPASNTWSPAGSMGTGRSTHTATLLPNGKVLVAGAATTPALSPAPSCTTRPATLGALQAAWPRDAATTPPRCCQTAWCW